MNNIFLLQIAAYVPGNKGCPSFVRLYQYPNFGGPTAALANKSFFKADKVTMLWNTKGTLSLSLQTLFPFIYYNFMLSVNLICALLSSSLKATAVLVTASTDVDKTGASYYGQQTLHYVATNGESAIVQLREYRQFIYYS